MGMESVGEQYLSFSVNQQCFAVPIVKVKEIVECGHITVVPEMGESIRGVVNLRGEVVPVMDLSARFLQGQTEVNRRTCIVIVEYANSENSGLIGLMVESVNAVLDLNATDISNPPQFGVGIQASLIAGVAKHQSMFVLLLKIDELLKLRMDCLLNGSCFQEETLAISG